MAANCTLELRSEKGGSRRVQMDGGFYTGYRRNILAADEILVSISVPYTEEDEHFVAFKQAKRRDDDIAIVNSAFFFKLGGSGEIQVNALLRLSVPSLEPPPSRRYIRPRTRVIATNTAIYFYNPGSIWYHFHYVNATVIRGVCAYSTRGWVALAKKNTM